MRATASEQQSERLRAIDELADAIRARAHALDEAAAFPAQTFAELRAAGLLALTAPEEYGGAGLWWDGRYRDYYELIERLALIDSVTAQLLQVHSHALGIVARLVERRAAQAAAAGDRRARQAARIGRQRGEADRGSSRTSRGPSSRS